MNSSAGATDRSAGLSAAAAGTSLDFGIEYTLIANQDSLKKIIIDPFVKAHPNVSAVDLTVFSSASALDSGLKLDFASGTGPDVFDENGPSWMAPFADSHTALELDEFYAKYKLTKRLFPWAVEPNLYKGHYYAVPCEYEGLHLWYNVGMFKQYGWQVPKNYDDILDARKGNPVQGQNGICCRIQRMYRVLGVVFHVGAKRSVGSKRASPGPCRAAALDRPKRGDGDGKSKAALGYSVSSVKKTPVLSAITSTGPYLVRERPLW